jgi:hypothetical protein
MGKCYVDRYFKVTQSLSLRKALVTEVPNWIEITFLEPICHNRGMSDAWKFLSDWGRRNYPRFSFNFPRVETCLVANDGEVKPVLFSCYTSTLSKKFDRSFYYSLDAEGKFCEEPLIAGNVYASFLMHPGEFFFLNPGVDLKRYQTHRYL